MTKRTYDKEFKIQAVKLAKGRVKAEVARELGLAEQTLHNWIKKYAEEEKPVLWAVGI
jgi:transposase